MRLAATDVSAEVFGFRLRFPKWTSGGPALFAFPNLPRRAGSVATHRSGHRAKFGYPKPTLLRRAVWVPRVSGETPGFLPVVWLTC